MRRDLHPAPDSVPCFEARPLVPGDRAAYVAAFERLSPETRQLRFGTAKPRLSERELRYLVDVDHHDHEALVALACETGEVVAVARYVRLPDEPGAAEVAVTVADAWQGRGIGPRILDRLAARAREEGVERLIGFTMPGNDRAARALARAGYAAAGAGGGMLRFERLVDRTVAWDDAAETHTKLVIARREAAPLSAA